MSDKLIQEIKELLAKYEEQELKVGDYILFNNFFVSEVIEVTDGGTRCRYPDGLEITYNIAENLKKITKEEYEAEKALLADGWIRHTGDRHLISDDVIVEIRGDTVCGKHLVGEVYNWRNVSHYRIVKEKTKGLWKPKDDEKYFSVFGNGSIVRYCWLNTDEDNYRFSQGNTFKTEEEAKTYREKVLDVEGKLRMIANNDPVDWGVDEEQSKYYFNYDYEYEVFSYNDWECARTQGTIYLTEAGKDKALKEIGEEALEYMIRNKR
jgi:hypothetical protein